MQIRSQIYLNHNRFLIIAIRGMQAGNTPYFDWIKIIDKRWFLRGNKIQSYRIYIHIRISRCINYFAININSEINGDIPSFRQFSCIEILLFADTSRTFRPSSRLYKHAFAYFLPASTREMWMTRFSDRYDLFQRIIMKR